MRTASASECVFRALGTVTTDHGTDVMQVLGEAEEIGYDVGYKRAGVIRRPGRGSSALGESVFQEGSMEKQEKKGAVRIELTEEQKRQIKEKIGKDAKAIELTAEELEERVSPTKRGL